MDWLEDMHRRYHERRPSAALEDDDELTLGYVTTDVRRVQAIVLFIPPAFAYFYLDFPTLLRDFGAVQVESQLTQRDQQSPGSLLAGVEHE